MWESIMDKQKEKIDKIFKTFTGNKQIHESILLLEDGRGEFSYSVGYGGKKVDTPFLMASITKLFTSTCILILREQGKLSLDDEISKYLEEKTLNNLHIYKGQEYSIRLTVSNLLCHTSGLPDPVPEGDPNAKRRMINNDRQMSLDETVIASKQLKPHFAPSNGKRAHYANINFDLLGKIIENITEARLEDIYKQYIFNPLGLKHTYLPINEHDFVPNIYYKNTSFHRPKMISSIRASGGCVSTAHELMKFIKAFFGGTLFNKAVFQELEVRNKLQAAMGPIQYGAGYMKIPLNGLTTLFMGKGELLGHAGSTGSFAFYYPASDLFLVGDVNQMANPALPIRLAIRLAMTIKP